MKIFIVFLIIISINQPVFSQFKETKKYKKTPSEFKELYNSGSYVALYSLFTYDFQKQVSNMVLAKKLIDLKSYVGEIKDLNYIPVKDSIVYNLYLKNDCFLKILMNRNLKINQIELHRQFGYKSQLTDFFIDTTQHALYKDKKNNRTKSGENSDLGNQNITNSDPSSFYGEVGFKPLPLSKFSNLVLPEDDGTKTGRIMVRILVNKEGKITSATAGAKGTTFSDTELFRKCERTMLNSSLNPIENGPDLRTFYVPFVFRVK